MKTIFSSRRFSLTTVFSHVLSRCVRRCNFLVMMSLSFFIVFNGFAHAQFFGPNNFDDCILQNMRGVTSDAAANAIYRSCREKFPANRSPVIPNSSMSITPVCEVFWNGRAFVLGKPKEGFKQLMISQYNVERFLISLPVAMYTDFQNQRSKFDMQNPSDPWYDFWRQHFYSIDRLCSA